MLKELSKCIRCGFCRASCPFFYLTKLDSSAGRGKIELMKSALSLEISMDEISEQIFKCTTCGRCYDDCPAGVETHRIIQEFRGRMKPLEQHLKIRESVLKNHNPFGEPHEKRFQWAKRKEIEREGKVAYFAGCTASYRVRSIAIDSSRILSKAGVDFCYLEEWCCGSPLLRTGQRKIAEETMMHNIEELRRKKIRLLLLSCPGCTLTFTRDYPLVAEKYGLTWRVKTLHISQLFYRLLKRGRIKLKEVKGKVVYHHPCHLRQLGIDRPKVLLESIVRVYELPPGCCGSGGGVRSAFGRISEKIAERRMKEARSKAGIIVSSCGLCELAFQRMEVRDLTYFLLKSIR